MEADRRDREPFRTPGPSAPDPRVGPAGDGIRGEAVPAAGPNTHVRIFSPRLFSPLKRPISYGAASSLFSPFRRPTLYGAASSLFSPLKRPTLYGAASSLFSPFRRPISYGAASLPPPAVVGFRRSWGSLLTSDVVPAATAIRRPPAMAHLAHRPRAPIPAAPHPTARRPTPRFAARKPVHPGSQSTPESSPPGKTAARKHCCPEASPPGNTAARDPRPTLHPASPHPAAQLLLRRTQRLTTWPAITRPPHRQSQ